MFIDIRTDFFSVIHNVPPLMPPRSNSTSPEVIKTDEEEIDPHDRSNWLVLWKFAFFSFTLSFNCWCHWFLLVCVFGCCTAQNNAICLDSFLFLSPSSFLRAFLSNLIQSFATRLVKADWNVSKKLTTHRRKHPVNLHRHRLVDSPVAHHAYQHPSRADRKITRGRVGVYSSK